MIDRHADYMQFTIQLSENYARNESEKIITPIAFYRVGYEYENGLRMYYGNPNSTRALCILSGKSLNTVRNTGVSDQQILSTWIAEGANFSRLDLAVTEWIEDSLVTMTDILSWFEKGLIESPLKAGGAKLLQSLNEWDRIPETLYIGNMKNRAKQGIFRAYDKGIEQGIGGEIATRIELEFRREKAQWAATKIASGEKLASVFRHRFDCSSEDFNRLMEAPAVEVLRGKNKEKNKSEWDEKMDKRTEWLLEQVAPALRDWVKYQEKSGDLALLEQFILKSGLANEMMRGAKWYANRNRLEKEDQ